MASALLAQLRFQILEARAQRARRRLAAELDRDLRRLAAQEAHDAGLDRRIEMRLVARHALERMARDETHFYTTIKTCIMGFLRGQPPQVAIEFGRKSTPGPLRPSFKDLETQLRKKG